jgi:hypothetical protein
MENYRGKNATAQRDISTSLASQMASIRIQTLVDSLGSLLETQYHGIAYIS